MTPTRQDQRSGYPCGGGDGSSPGAELVTRSVLETQSLDELLEGCFPSFGGAYLKRVWKLLDDAIGQGFPMTLAVAGPVTLSGQTHTWLGPLLDTGWFCLVSTTDAVCYHDGHRSLPNAKEHPIHEVPLHGDDGALRESEIIRVTDIGFDEQVLLDQDVYLRRLFERPEFQERMSGTVFRHRLGLAYAEEEKKHGIREGLLALCARKSIPIFVGAPSDGSAFLNSMALWARARNGGPAHKLELDLHEEVYESCAYHLWGLSQSPTKALGTLVLGGGVPKNFNLQPEPALSQILGLEDVSGYVYDIQLTTAPVTYGSLSSCPPSEAVTWGKVDKDEYKRTTESFQCDYTVVMPLLAKALLDKRARFERWGERMGREALVEKHPEAAGYLRDRDGYRLFEKRAELLDKLDTRIVQTANAL